MKLVDLSNRQFGKWKVLELDVERTQREGDAYWLCQCECSYQSSVLGRSLRNGSSRGCVRCRRKVNAGIGARNEVLRGYQWNAKDRGLSWELSDEIFFSLISQNCRYCGAPPSMISKQQGRTQTYVFFYNGLDRVDNTQGYTAENVVACCKLCNNAKSTMTLEAFGNWIDRVFLHLHQDNMTKHK